MKVRTFNIEAKKLYFKTATNIVRYLEHGADKI